MQAKRQELKHGRSADLVVTNRSFGYWSSLYSSSPDVSAAFKSNSTPSPALPDDYFECSMFSLAGFLCSIFLTDVN